MNFFHLHFKVTRRLFFFPGQLLAYSVKLIVKIIESKFYGSVDCVLELTQCNH